MYGPCRSTIVADRPLSPATRRRLGRPLPHQLADRTQAHLEAPYGFNLTITWEITSPFGKLYPTSRQIPAYYSPVHRYPRSCDRDPLICMPKARRQRSSWARIKLSKRIVGLRVKRLGERFLYPFRLPLFPIKKPTTLPDIKKPTFRLVRLYRRVVYKNLQLLRCWSSII